MKVSRAAVYAAVIAAVALLAAYMLASGHLGLFRHGKPRQPTLTVRDVELAVQREVERMLSMYLLLSATLQEGSSTLSPQARSQLALARLASIATSPLIVIIPEKMTPGDSISLKCSSVMPRVARINTTAYTLKPGTRLTHVTYEFRVASRNKLLYTSSHKLHSGMVDITTNYTGVLVYQDGYMKEAVFNATTGTGRGGERPTVAIRQSYDRGIMTSIEAVTGQHRTRLLFDRQTGRIILERNGHATVLNTSTVESLAELLTRLPSSVKVELLNTTQPASPNGAGRSYTLLVTISAAAGNPPLAGIEARIVVTLVEEKPWLLVETSRHIVSFKAWIQLDATTYTVAGRNIAAYMQCSPSGAEEK